ncbi:site-specific integrase [Larkinella punicea]|uniref:site-specific integrase n=1 Tax=Larkinella punicea TaxID=2315727 RepID=UPI001E2E4697|nr:site-specific integrase [Larkinella punicea]
MYQTVSQILIHATATAAIVLDTRRKKTDDTYPLKLRITYQRVRKYYRIGIDLTEPIWLEVEDKSKTRRELREIRERLSAFQSRAEQTIKGIENFDFDSFEASYFQNFTENVKEKALRNDIVPAYSRYIKQLEEEGRASYAGIFKSSITSLETFKKRLKFSDVTPDFLKKYEKWMLQEGNSVTSIGMWLRPLRTIFNIAIEDGVVTREQYPFGKRKYQIPGGQNIKKALTLAEVEKIFHFHAVTGSQEDKARDFWIFSYLCNGVNMKDICRLKWKNIEKDSVTFIRAKTELTNKSNIKPIVAVLTEPSLHVIHKWGGERVSPDSYVFPILSPGLTPKRERELVQYFTKFVNKWMQRVADALGIDKPVTTYYARHSFATVLKRSGAPIEFISESLGHSDMKTTDNYLDGFEDDTKREYTKALLNFNR